MEDIFSANLTVQYCSAQQQLALGAHPREREFLCHSKQTLAIEPACHLVQVAMTNLPNCSEIANIFYNTPNGCFVCVCRYALVFALLYL